MEGIKLKEMKGNWEGGYMMGNVQMRKRDKNEMI